jgi:hypothetical protein
VKHITGSQRQQEKFTTAPAMRKTMLYLVTVFVAEKNAHPNVVMLPPSHVQMCWSGEGQQSCMS